MVLVYFIVSFVILGLLIAAGMWWYSKKEPARSVCNTDKAAAPALHVMSWTGNDIDKCMPYTCDAGYEINESNVCVQTRTYINTVGLCTGANGFKAEGTSGATDDAYTCEETCNKNSACLAYDWKKTDPKTCNIYITKPTGSAGDSNVQCMKLNS